MSHREGTPYGAISAPENSAAIDRGAGPRSKSDEFFVGTHSTHGDIDDFVPEPGKVSDAHIGSETTEVWLWAGVRGLSAYRSTCSATVLS